MKMNIEKNFTDHMPEEELLKRYKEIHSIARDYRRLIEELCPNGRERSLAITKLKESVMWASASILKNG